MKTKHYKCVYGSMATLTEHSDGTATLSMQAGLTKTRKRYNSVRGARSAMNRASDGWKEA